MTTGQRRTLTITRDRNGTGTGQERDPARDPLPGLPLPLPLPPAVEDQEGACAPPPADAGPCPPPPPLAERDPLPDLWAALVAWMPRPGAVKLTPARRKHLEKRVQEHGEGAVLEVATWVHTSTHDRARFLRDRGDVDTLLRPEKFANYLGMSQQPTFLNGHATGPPSKPSRVATTSAAIGRFLDRPTRAPGEDHGLS